MSTSDPAASAAPSLAPSSPSPVSPAPPRTPEEKERHWFEHVYAGDDVPQLTLRANQALEMASADRAAIRTGKTRTSAVQQRRPACGTWRHSPIPSAAAMRRARGVALIGPGWAAACAASTSRACTRSLGPLPTMSVRSTPSSRARALAFGVATTGPAATNWLLAACGLDA